MKDGTKKILLIFQGVTKGIPFRLPVLPQKSDNFCHKYENFAYPTNFTLTPHNFVGSKTSSAKLQDVQTLEYCTTC